MRYSLLLIVALASAGVGAALTLVVRVHTTAIPAADWLQFAGALVGVILAIWGALAVEHWRHGDDDRVHRGVGDGGLVAGKGRPATELRPERRGPDGVAAGITRDHVAAERAQVGAVDAGDEATAEVGEMNRSGGHA